MHAFEAKVGVEKYPIFIGNKIFKELNFFIKTYNKNSVFIISDSYFKNSNTLIQKIFHLFITTTVYLLMEGSKQRQFQITKKL